MLMDDIVIQCTYATHDGRVAFESESKSSKKSWSSQSSTNDTLHAGALKLSVTVLFVRQGCVQEGTLLETYHGSVGSPDGWPRHRAPLPMS